MTGSSEPRAAKGRNAERSHATRAALVELAAEVFAKEGYQQTSIRDVARRGALTTGAIYGNFRNKADLLVEAINKRVAEELEARTMGLATRPNYIDALTKNALDFRRRRRLRALIVQGAAAALTDEETRSRLREEQLSHLTAWIKGYERDRDEMGIDPSVDLQAAVLFTWAAELGVGVLEAIGIEPKSTKGWADVFNRMARSLQLPPEDGAAKPRKATRKRT